jgi:DUF1365 family protein
VSPTLTDHSGTGRSTAALYECELSHARTAPLKHSFRYRTCLWLVDLDHLPRLPWYLRPWAGFRAADHLGDPSASIRSNMDKYLTENGIDLDGGRILMLSYARVLGYVFNPMTVFWCHDPAGRQLCVVVEVHNTYGGRHRYLLYPDERGRASAVKEFYVSPFFPVDGSYRLRLPEPDLRLALSVTLDRAGGTPFAATLRGTRRPVTVRSVLRTALRHPLSTVAVSLRIRKHGLQLFLRGLPVHPRPTPVSSTHENQWPDAPRTCAAAQNRGRVA